MIISSFQALIFIIKMNSISRIYLLSKIFDRYFHGRAYPIYTMPAKNSRLLCLLVNFSYLKISHKIENLFGLGPNNNKIKSLKDVITETRGVLFECHWAVVPFCWAGRPDSRLLTGIPILAVFQNLMWNSNKTSLYKWHMLDSYQCKLPKGKVFVNNI